MAREESNGRKGRMGWGEDVLALAAILTMVAVPAVEALARFLHLPGVPGGIIIVQHLTLWIAFLGAAVAAHQGRLLSLFQTAVTSERETSIGWFPRTVALAVVIGLAWGSFTLVRMEAKFAADLLPSVPRWVIQSIMPVGFLLIAVRLFLQSPNDPVRRAVMVAVVVVIGAIGLGGTLQLRPVLLLAIVAIVIALVRGAPLFIGLGGIALVLFWYDGIPSSAIAAEAYRIVVSPTLPTLPLFTLAGYLLGREEPANRLIRLFSALLGWVPGGIPVVVILLCAFFTAMTGGSGVTILALGGLLLPMLLEHGYSARVAVGLITVAGSLGLLFPPSLPAIVYCVTSQIAIDSFFADAVLPGLLLVGMLAAQVIWKGGRRARRGGVDFAEIRRALWEAKWEVAFPVIILAGIFGGYTTLVESAAIAVIFLAIVGLVIHRDLKIGEVPTLVLQSASLIGGVLIILACAMGFTSYLVDAQVPMALLEWVREHVHSPWIFLLALNGILLIVGGLMDIFSAIIIVAPILAPIAGHFGIDPTHMAIVFLANLEIGFLTPPIGVNLFLSAYRFDRSMGEVFRSTLPFFLARLAGVALLTYLPLILS